MVLRYYYIVFFYLEPCKLHDDFMHACSTEQYTYINRSNTTSPRRREEEKISFSTPTCPSNQSPIPHGNHIEKTNLL